MDNAEGFVSEFEFSGNAKDFIDGILSRIDEAEKKLNSTFSRSMSKAMDSMDAFAASCVDADTDLGKLFHRLGKEDAMDDLAATAMVANKSLEELYFTGKDLDDLLKKEAKDTAEFERRLDSLAGTARPAFNRVGVEAESMETRLDKLGESWGKLRNMGIAVGAAMTAAGYGIWRSLDKTTEFVDGLDESAQAAGTTATALSQLQYAAKKGGSSAEELSVALKTVSVNAASGDKAFGRLGINVRDASGQLKKSDQLFLEVGNKLQGMEDRTQAAAIATQLFGRSGSQMLAVFGNAPGTIEATMKEAEKLGLVFTDEEIQAASDFQDSIQKVGTAFELASAKMLAGVGPKVTQFLERLSEKFAAFAESDAGKQLAEGIGRFADAAMRAFDVLTKLAPKVIEIGLKISDIVLPVAELLAKFLELPGAADAVGVAIAAAFGGMAVGRVVDFGSNLFNVIGAMNQMSSSATAAAGAFEMMGAGTGGLAGKVDAVRGALNGLNTAAKASIALLAAWAVFEAYKAVDGVIQERKDHKKTMGDIKAQDNFGSVQLGLAKELDEARRNGDTERVFQLKRKLEANRATWSGVRPANELASSDAKGSVHNTWNTTTITQQNNVRADISNVREFLDKNLDTLMKDHLHIEGISRHLALVGGV